MKHFLLAATLPVALIATTSAHASTYDIIFEYVAAGDPADNGQTAVDFTDRQKDLLEAAAGFWESAIVGFQGIANPVLTLTTSLAPIPSTDGNVLAFAGPRSVEAGSTNPNTSNPYLLPDTGIIQFDSVDYGPRSEQDFLDVAIHEIAHAMGFGTLFDFNQLLDANDNYIGTEALGAFNVENGTNVTSILMQEGGGHWSECWIASLTGTCSDTPGTTGFLNDREAMTPFISNAGLTMSPVTIAAFRDLGYTTTLQQTYNLPVASEVTSAVPLPAGGLLLLTGLAGLGASRRARKAA